MTATVPPTPGSHAADAAGQRTGAVLEAQGLTRQALTVAGGRVRY